MAITVLGIILNLIPITYGIVLFVKAERFIKNHNEQEIEENYKKIQRWRRSGSIFFFVGAYLLYETYKRLF